MKIPYINKSTAPRQISTITFLLVSMTVVNAQVSDTTSIDKTENRVVKSKNTLSPKSLILPGALITYGFATLASNGLKNVNQEI
jgi:hypothetical protein